jgi:NDP-sugar pyrophosphorylase family protein
MNGDIVTTLDYAELMRAHSSSGATLTIATHHKNVGIDLGVIESAGGFVSDYIEKPTLHYTVSMGIYVYEPRTVERVPQGYFDLPDLVRMLLEEGEPVGVFPFDGMWFDIGTPADHERALAEVEAHPELFDA